MNSAASTAVSGSNNSSDKNSNTTTAMPAATKTPGTDSTSQMPDVEILMNFTNRVIPTRIWEIRILQIPFSQRAPAGCLQYFTGHEGIIQTFNFADNGRHLANQDYKACIRQEKNMCSIAYEPCDEQSFRIGPNNVDNDEPVTPIGLMDMGSVTPVSNLNMTSTELVGNTSLAADPVFVNTSSEAPPFDLQSQASEMNVSSTIPPSSTEAVEVTQPSPPTTQADEPPEEDEEIEGSGGDAGTLNENKLGGTSTKGPVGGGFDVFSFLSNVFDLRRRRSSRQFFSTCTDRITMPCIVEDFIAAGMGTLPGCEPVHCGDQFCSTGTNNNCKIESTVTPFYLGIHFGDGIGKGSPEENIGACLKYSQMPCL